MYTSKDKALSQFLPTSSAMASPLLRSHYFVNMSLGLLDTKTENPQPVNFGWELFNGTLVPDQCLRIMPVEFTTTCGCNKGCGKGRGCTKIDLHTSSESTFLLPTVAIVAEEIHVANIASVVKVMVLANHF